MHPCQNCSDWWSDATHVSPDEYPNPPSFELRNLSEPPNVKLSFNMIRNSLMRVEEWHNQHRHETYSTGVLRKYLQLICIGYGKEIHKEMRDSEVSVTSLLHLYPPILNEFESLGIEVDFFIATVMHKFFLGCQKKNVLVSNYMKLDSDGNTWWRDFYNCLQSVQKELMNIPIQWCNVMSFSTGSKKDEGEKSLEFLDGCQITV